MRFARTFRGITQTELATAISVSQATIVSMEKGNEPSALVLQAAALALGVMPAFFGTRLADEFTEANCNFRRGSKSAEKIRTRVLSQGTLFAHLMRHLQGRLTLPAYNVPEISASASADVEAAADHCRLHWGLGLDRPIISMVRVLENAGVLVTRLREEDGVKLDAFSHRGREGGLSYVVLNPLKGSASRTRFDMAHELGHLVLHSKSSLEFAVIEDQAERFGGAFLLPRAGFTREFRRSPRPSLELLMAMKKRWGVSMQAISYRALHLGLIDVIEHRRIYKLLASRQWIRQEPNEPQLETPELFRRALQTLWEKKFVGPAELAVELHWTVEMFELVTGIRSAEFQRPTPQSKVVPLFGGRPALVK